MKIKKILDFSPYSKEADLIVTDGKNECLVFAPRFNGHEGDEIVKPLSAIFVENLRITEDKIPLVRKTDSDYFSQYCVAKVLDKENDLVAIGNIIIDLGSDLPGWANNGDFIEFDCGRLDYSSSS